MNTLNPTHLSNEFVSRNAQPNTKSWFIPKPTTLYQLIIAASLSILLSMNARATLAFPGAQGFGANSIGGRGGTVYAVTNTNDSGPGSLREAVETTGPRTVIFNIGGTITLLSTLAIENPYITIAGQTAPGGGIQLRGATLLVETHDVIVRGMRFRPGDSEPGGTESTNRDGINIRSPNAGTLVHDVIFDHNSIQWAIDESISVWGTSDIFDVTYQWNVIAEALHDSIHIDEECPSPCTETDPHSMGPLFGASPQNNDSGNIPAGITLHHNYIAHNNSRNPKVSGAKEVEIINNVVYNFGQKGMNTEARIATVHFFDNYYKLGWGADTNDPQNGIGNKSTSEIFRQDGTPDINNSGYYLSGNYRNSPKIKTPYGESAWNTVGGNQGAVKTSNEFTPSAPKVIRDSALDAVDSVLAWAGALHPQRDAVDTRCVNDFDNVQGLSANTNIGGVVPDTPEDRILQDNNWVTVTKPWDGNDNSSWHNGGDITDRYLTFDLGFTLNLTSLKMKSFRADERDYKWKIETSTDQKNFTEIYNDFETPDTTDWITYDVTDGQARFVRIHALGWVNGVPPSSTGNWNYLSEIEMFDGATKIFPQFDTDGYPILNAGTAPLDYDGDGMPNDWELGYSGSDKYTADGNVDADGDGYTNLEEYLNSFYVHSHVRNSLVAYYWFNTQVQDLSGARWFLDKSGNNNDLSVPLLSTAASDAEGVAVSFNTAQDEFGEMTAIPLSNDFTITLWVKQRTVGQRNPLFSRMSGHNLYPRGEIMATGQIRLQFKTGGTTRTVVTNTANGIADSDWHHLAFGFNDASNTGFIYRDGVEVKKLTYFSGSLDTGSNLPRIGRDGSDTMDCDLDEFRVYTRTLTQDEIQILAGP